MNIKTKKTHDFQNDGVIKPKIKCVELQERNSAQVQLEFSNSSDSSLDVSPVFHPEVKPSNNPDPQLSNNPDPQLSDDSSALPEVKPSNKPNPWLSDDSSVSSEVNSVNNSSDFESSRYNIM